MRDYELTLVLDPDLKTEEQKKLQTKIAKLITDFKGKIAKKDEWGKKELSYPIKKKKMGVYFCWFVKLLPEAVGQLDKKLKLEESIMRYLIIKKEEGSHGSKVTQ